nr:venom polypeptide precursor [Doratifera vulnerans]
MSRLLLVITMFAVFSFFSGADANIISVPDRPDPHERIMV